MSNGNFGALMLGLTLSVFAICLTFFMNSCVSQDYEYMKAKLQIEHGVTPEDETNDPN